MTIAGPIALPMVRALARPVVRSRSPLAAETTALVARFSGAPSLDRKVKIDTLIKALKVAGVWAKLDALYVLAAHDAQAAQRNWIADAYNLTPTNAPTFTADRGYAGNGSTSYLDTGFNPSTAAGKFQRNDAYFGIWSRTAGQTTASCAGYFSGTDGVSILPRSASNLMTGRINQAAADDTSPTSTVTDGSGLFGVTRTGASALRLARNGAELDTGTTASTALVNGNFRLGSIGAVGFSTIELSAGLIGSQLTVAEETAAYAALNAYYSGVAGFF